MRRFLLVRHADPSGVSGTGIVAAQGVEFRRRIGRTALVVLPALNGGVGERRRHAADPWLHRSPSSAGSTASTPIDVHRRFGALCDRAEVRRIRFHDLRHSCGTLLYEMGVPIEHIQDVLRHANPTITKTLYVDSTKRVQRTALDKLGNLLEGDPDA